MLTDDGDGNVSWTSPYDAPFGWRLDQSFDGGVTWSQWDTVAGNLRIDGGPGGGTLTRVYAPLSDGFTQGSSYSNVVASTP